MSLVKRPASPGARILFYKAEEDSVLDHLMAGLRKAFGVAAAVNAPDGTAISEDQRLSVIDDALGEVRAALEAPVAPVSNVVAAALRDALAPGAAARAVAKAAADEAHWREHEANLSRVEKMYGIGAEPVQVTKAAVAGSLDDYVESRRRPRETTAAAWTRLAKEDRTMAEAYDLYCAAAPDPLPEPEPRKISKAEATIVAKAERLREREFPELTFEQAFVRALERDPALYDQYLASQPQH